MSRPVRWRVTVLTPTLAGDGGRLAPIDYMVWKNQVNVLDQAFLFRRLAGTPRLEGYLDQLRQARRLDFANWGGYAQSYASRRIPLEDPSLAAWWEQARDEDIFIPTFPADARGRWLPASAVKGALRTAVLDAELDAAEFAALLGEEPAPRTAARRLEQSRAARPLSGLRLGDGREAGEGRFAVYYSRVATPARPDGREVRWKPQPVFAECAAPGTVFTGVGTAAPAMGERLRAAGLRSRAALAAQRQWADRIGLPRVAAALAAAAESPGCLLRLGWGAGFASKSLATGERLAAARPLLEPVPAFRRALESGFPFPKSQRVLYTEGGPGTVPGWVSLQIEDTF